MRDTFIFYRSFKEALKMLPDPERHTLQDALIEYALDGVVPTLEGYLAAIFELIRPTLDRDRKLYENGTKGGRPKKPNENQNETKAKPNGNQGKNQNETKAKPTPSNDNNNNIYITSPNGDSININKKNITSTRFVKPTVEEVRVYCKERGNDIDPEAFIDHYEAKGWLIGKQPMKDWQAAVRTWERNHQSSPSDAQAINTAVPQVPGWRVLEEGNPNNPPAKEWAAFLEYLDKKNSPLVITGPQYIKVKVMAQYDKQDFRRVIKDLIRMAPIQTSIEQEADHLLDMYRIDPNYQAPINPKSNQKE